MRRALVLLASLLSLTILPALAADPPPQVKGLWLLTEYPSTVAKPGETTSVKLKLQNAGLAPETLDLKVTEKPADWKVDILGGGQMVAAAMPAINESVTLTLRLEVPANTPAGTYPVTVTAKGATNNAELKLAITVSGDVAAKLSMKTRLPALRGTPKSSFEYTFTVSNDSGKDLVVRFAADGPRGFQPTFTEAYGSNEINQIPIEAGQTKDIKMRVGLPRDVAAGDYTVRMRATAENVTAEVPVTMQIIGTPTLRVSGRDGRLSGAAEAGNASPVVMVVSNDGSAVADDVELSGSMPSGWKVEFEPKRIDKLPPGEKKEVTAHITPTAKALAGDYIATLRAAAKAGDSATADFRIAVTTSTLWGVIGVAVIAVALFVLFIAVARFGRR
ncbi:MAG: NEW3 domain-containing protein [Reyranellaceae bacterium]